MMRKRRRRAGSAADNMIKWSTTNNNNNSQERHEAENGKGERMHDYDGAGIVWMDEEKPSANFWDIKKRRKTRIGGAEQATTNSTKFIISGLQVQPFPPPSSISSLRSSHFAIRWRQKARIWNVKMNESEWELGIGWQTFSDQILMNWEFLLGSGKRFFWWSKIRFAGNEWKPSMNALSRSTHSCLFVLWECRKKLPPPTCPPTFANCCLAVSSSFTFSSAILFIAFFCPKKSAGPKMNGFFFIISSSCFLFCSSISFRVQ